jgi:hypothetical protein
MDRSSANHNLSKKEDVLLKLEVNPFKIILFLPITVYNRDVTIASLSAYKPSNPFIDDLPIIH